jgi:glucose-6-phosphate dehydrogenase assembly protein OpcA
MPDRAELKVTVAVGAALLAQTALALLWTGAAAERLAQLERRADSGAMLVERVARLEEQVTGARAQLARIEAKLDRASSE